MRKNKMILALLAAFTLSACQAPVATPTAQTSQGTASSTTVSLTIPDKGQTTSANLYYVQLEDNGQNGEAFGCSDSLITLKVEIPGNLTTTAQKAEFLYQKLLSSPTPENLYNSLESDDLQLISATVENKKLTVKLSGELITEGTCEAPRILEQLNRPGKQFADIEELEILVNDQALYNFFE